MGAAMHQIKAPETCHPLHLSPAARRLIEQRAQQLRQQLARRRAARPAAPAPQPQEA